MEVSWGRYGVEGGPPLPPQPDAKGRLPGTFLGQSLRVGKDGGRVRYANRGGRNAVWSLAMQRLKGKGKGKQDWPGIADLWLPPPDTDAIHVAVMAGNGVGGLPQESGDASWV